MPQKRSAEQSTLPAAKKAVGQTSQVGSLQASTSQRRTEDGVIKQLQSTISELEARISALSNPAPTLTAEQVIELIDTRLAQQRQEFQQAVQGLQQLCETGFVNTQASFDAVGDWKENVQQSFAKIQDWATAIEEKLVGCQVKETSQTVSDRPIQFKYVSSTPSTGHALPWQTPAAPVITTAHTTHRPSRLSDALDFSLATIPEAPNTPLSADERKASLEVAPSPSASCRADTLETGAEQVRVRAQAEVINTPETAETTQEIDSVHSLAYQTSTQSAEASQPLIAFTPQQVTCTPRSAKTLFGTEQSSEARFEDILEIMGDSVAQEASVLPPTWTSLSPSKLLKEG